MLGRTFLLFTSPAILVAASCSNVVVDAESSGSSTGEGAATSSTATSSTASTSSGAGGSSTASTSSSGAGGSVCAGSVELTVNDGPQQQFTANCSDNASDYPGPVGFIQGGPSDGTLQIFACPSTAPNSENLHLSAVDATGPGTYTTGFIGYTDAMGSGWGASNPLQIVITAFGAVGDSIDGTFSGGSGDFVITGSFHVCRTPDAGPLPP
jgi:hypothetical protein